MICLMSSQVRFSVAGSWASAFQKLLIQSVLRVAMMSSYTARTSGPASAYSMNPKVAIQSPLHHLEPASSRVIKLFYLRQSLQNHADGRNDHSGGKHCSFPQ